MTAAEIAARLDAYRDALAIVGRHANMCSEVASLHMDIDASLRRKIAELEAQAAAAETPKRGRGKGDG